MKSILLLTALFSIGCASQSKLSRDDSALKQAIIENRLELVRQIVGAEDLSQRSELLDLAVADKEHCRDQIVEFLLQRRAAPSSTLGETCQDSLFSLVGAREKCSSQIARRDNFSDSIQNECPGVFSKIVAIASKEKLANLAETFTQNFIPHKINSGAWGNACLDPDGSQLKPVSQILENLQRNNQAYCSNQNTPDNCLWSAKLSELRTKFSNDYSACVASQEKRQNDQMEKQRQREIEHEKDNSPESRICFAQSQIALADQLLTREREIGKRSGFVNKRTMHTQTSVKMWAQEQLKTARAEYKKTTGKDFDLNTCKTELPDSPENK